MEETQRTRFYNTFHDSEFQNWFPQRWKKKKGKSYSRKTWKMQKEAGALHVKIRKQTKMTGDGASPFNKIVKYWSSEEESLSYEKEMKKGEGDVVMQEGGQEEN